jgi:ABC-2 type transport system permease protein
MVATQARTETLLAFRNGEQVLLTLLIPILLLVALSLINFVPSAHSGVPAIDAWTPRIFALAVLSSAFTGQAIALGFDRRYGVLKRLMATALPRGMVVAGRMISALAVVVVQLAILSVIAGILGWTPWARGGAGVLVLVVLGTLAFGALGLLLGGALKAEVVLAVGNLVWFVLLVVGGIVLPSSFFHGAWGLVVELLPSGALAEGLDAALVAGTVFPWQQMVVLAVWAGLAGLLASRTTRVT